MIKSPLSYFIMVFVLSVPFYFLGATDAHILGLSILPASAFMVVVPLIVAITLIYQQRGSLGVMALLKSTLVYQRSRGMGWILVALLFMPFVFILEFAIIRLTGVALPLPKITPSQIPFLFLVFFVGAIAEEAGWQGYAYPALYRRLGTLRAAVVLGAVWGLWHVVPFVQQGRGADWIVWQCLSTVAMRIIIVWLFENSNKSIFIAVLLHTMFNVSWALFPLSGSFYDPFITFVILAVAVGLIGTKYPFRFFKLRTKI
jgi:uncharacterized protein